MFIRKISKDVYWVPANILGKSCLSKKYISENTSKEANAKEIHALTPSLADALKTFDVLQYKACDDTVIIEEQGLQWEHHPPVFHILKNKRGNCSSSAAWLVEMLQNKYDSVDILLIFRNNQTGHVINVIEQENMFYFVDMYMHMYEYQQYLCPETGSLADFAKQKYITSVVYMAKTVEAFTAFYSRVLRNQIREHIYVLFNTKSVPPIASRTQDDKVILYIPANTVKMVINKTGNMLWEGQIHPEYLPKW